MNILAGLNEQQRIAVEHFGRPLLVLAGAGSGKTTVITRKIAYLTRTIGVEPDRILAITFTRKAAEEMKERIEHMLEIRPKWVSTFHSFCVKLLREDIEALGKGYTKKFTIYDKDDSLKIIRDALKVLRLKTTDADRSKEVISRAKQDLRNNVFDHIRGLPFPDSSFAPVYEVYQRHLQQSNALDYDDLIYFAAELLITDDVIRGKWQQRFDAILVDEYQDTNRIQYSLVQLLAGANPNVTCVGDFFQAIYSFRGAHPENIIRFAEDFRAKEVKLEKNYRSTSDILNIANAIINKGHNRWKRRLVQLNTDNTSSGEIDHVTVLDNFEENDLIASKISNLSDQGFRYSDIAILIRMSLLSLGIEKTFMSMGIPYEIIGGLAFYERAEIKDMLAYFRFMLNRQDRAAFERIINTPARSIGDKTLAAIKDNYHSDWIQTLKSTTFTPKQQPNVDRFIRIIEKYADTIDNHPYETLIGLVDDIQYIQYLKSNYKEDFEDRTGNISELANVLKAAEQEGKTFSEFLEDSLLASAQDGIKDTNSVKIMTIHAAKGLEFPVVFIVGLEEEIFPAAKSMNDIRALEEERRLFYVAVTRAKERLYMTTAERRMKFGNVTSQRMSRYIEEIQEYLTMEKAMAYK